MAFKRAEQKQGKARIGLLGPAGSGKTFTALRLAKGLARGGRVAVIDTERGSAAKYAKRFEFDTDDEFIDFNPKALIQRIKDAEAAGYAVLIIDSLSHFWMGKNGALELVDQAKLRSKAKDGFGAWREITPIHNELVDTMLTARLHLIGTMRVKTEWVVEKGDDGKNHPRKIGLQPVQRDGLEYEFDLVGDLDDATFVCTKTRVSEVVPRGAVIKEPGEELGQRIAEWLDQGTPMAAPPDLTHWQAALKLGTANGWGELDVGRWLKEKRTRTARSTVTAEDVAALRAALEPPKAPEKTQAPAAPPPAQAKPRVIVDVQDGETEEQALARAHG